jgi:small-conductance mechanosensitive channel
MDGSNRIRLRALITGTLEVLVLLVAIGAGACLSPAMAQQSGDDSALVATEKGVSTAPVIIDGHFLFRVRGVTSYPATQRAQAIADRIRTLAADESVSVKSLRLLESKDSTDILAGDRFIMSVFNADARIEGAARGVLAGLYLKRISTAMLDYRAERGPEQLLRNTLLTAGCTLLVALALFLIWWTARRVTRRIERRYQSAVEKIETGSFRFISAVSIWKAVHAAFRIVVLLLALALVIVGIHFVLMVFPWTRGFAENFKHLALAPLFAVLGELIGTTPKLLVIVLIAIIARYLVRAARYLFSAIKQGNLKVSGFDPEWSDSTFNIIRVLIIAFAVVVCFPYVPGSESPAFRGVTIFIGVLFSLGSSSLLANLIAGYTMTYRRAFHLGDRIKVGDLMGDVTQVGLMVTHLRSVKNEEFVVPNSLILNSNVINYSALARERGLILHTTVGIGYETPWRQVEAMLLMAAERTPGLLSEPPPYILQQGLGDFCVTYELNVYSDKPAAMYQQYTDLHRSILDVFNEYNVQIMTPAYVSDPAGPKVVARDQWFAEPAQLPQVRKTGSG